jgi:intraflagellar transport protein 172
MGRSIYLLIKAFNKYIENLYSVTALCWKPDGSSLITGSLCGSVDLFEACVRKSVYKEKFEITYVSHTQVVVKNLETLRRLVLKPQYSTEITKININLDNYLVLFTKESLILGDIDQEKYSEFQWNPSGDEKFDFTNNNVCMIYNAGELTLVEYGNSQILGYCKTEYIHSNLISARLNYNVQAGIGKTTAIKIIAYLIDLNTIQIQDLSTQNMLCSINHDSKVDFLELNKNGTKLIFRDRKRHLYLYYVFDQKKVTLLNYCGYVQWVPNSDVLVAQDRKNLCVWYNVDDPDKVRIINVKGEVEEIRRKEGKTEVIVEEGNNSQIYLLDDGLIAFSTAIDEGDLNKAVKILENLEMNTDIETHWKTLAKLAISTKQLVIAQRCYAAIGSYSKANYVKKIIKIAEKNGVDSPLVEARLLIFDKQFSNAENLLINNKQLNEAMEIMNDMQKWEESIKLAVKYNHPEADNIKRQFYDWLLDSDQLDKAAEIKEQEGQFKEAIDLYLKGGYPVKAGNVIKNYNSKFDKELIEQIINALLNVGIFEKAGELLEILGQYKRALEAFVEAKSYSKAVEMAKKHLPKLVEKLEDEWGDWLMSQKQLEAAITHFIEAGSRTKAIEAAIGARKWDKAIELSNSINNESARPYLSMIGDHFAMQRLTDTAEKYYLKAKEPVKAFNMYVKYGRWDKAEQIIKKSMKDEDFSKTIVNEAIKYEQDGKLKEAEKLYIMAGEQDIAINMYRTAKQYDNMIRLVSTYRPDYLKSTHMLVAQLLEADKNLKQAEHHLVEAGNWKGAVEMYRAHNMWEEALRVAKTNGMKAEINEIAKKWVNNLPKDQATKMLMSMGLVEAAIDIEVDKKDFDNAFDIANKHAKYRVPYVHLKYAMFLEDEKRYHDAEEHYIKANQVEDVIQMYESQYDFQSALRVARQHDPQFVTKIYFNQGNYFLERREFSKAEMCFVNAKQPELMINAYRKMKMIKEAIAFAKKHIPAIVEDLVRLMIPDESSGVNGMEMLDNARYCEDAKDYYKAVEIYLDINESHFDNPEKLEEIWMKSVQIASTFLKNNASEIILNVAEKLRRIGRFRRAANLYETLGKIKEAIDSLIDGEMWELAHNLVNTVKDMEKHKQLQEYLISREQQGAYDKNDPLELCKLGDARGLEMFLKRGDIEKTLECADKFFSREIYNKYLIQIAYNLLQEKNLAGAAGLIAKNNAPIFKNNLKFYTKLALEILAEENLNEITNLKEMLYAVMTNLNANEFPNEFQVF